MAIELYYTLRKDKKPRKWRDSYISIPGSMEVFMRFMLYMEEKYLPSLPSPYPYADRRETYHSRWTACIFWNKEGVSHPMQEVWDLQLSPKTTHAERLTMASMMDRAFFNVIDFPKLAEVWLEVDNQMNAKYGSFVFGNLINAIRKLIHDTPGINTIAVHWSSVVNFYDSYGKTDKDCYDLVADNQEVEQQINNSKQNE